MTHLWRQLWRPLACVALGAAPSAWGYELPSDWVSARSISMGDAMTPLGNDETAPFTNPAGLARTRNPRSREKLHMVTFPNLVVGANGSSAASLAKARNLSALLETVFAHAQETPGEPAFAEVQMFPALSFGAREGGTWLIGIPIRSRNFVLIPDPDAPTTAYVQSQTTIGGALNWAAMTRSRRFYYGVSIRPNYRYNWTAEDYDATNTNYESFKNKVKNDSRTSSAVNTDAGFIFTAADYWLPTFGFAIRNIPTGCVDDYTNPLTLKTYTMCGTLRKSSSSDAPASEQVDPTEIRAGFSLTPRMKVSDERVNLHLSVDVWPIPVRSGSKNYGFTDLEVSEYLHAGGELYFGNAILQEGMALRAGISQGNMTWGANLNLWGLELIYASYAVNIRTTKGRKIDRRHMGGFTYNF